MSANTCFVLGAGFSAPAGLPIQSELLRHVRENEKIYGYIKQIFNFKSDVGDEILDNIALEDVFTFLDKVIHKNMAIYNDNYDDEEITENESDLTREKAYQAERDIIDYIIGKVTAQLKLLKNSRLYEHFFDSIVKRKIEDDETNTVITINWDTLPDFYINKAFEHFGIAKGGVDYCCFDWDYKDMENEHEYTPSIYRKAKGWKTIKLIKLHGSINWVYGKKQGVLYVQQQTDDYPNGIILSEKDTEDKKMWHPRFEHIFMSPTFTKDFSNMYTQSMLHNAQFDLSEAKRIVFLGCSLPLADYEFRNLFMRTAVRNKKNKIRVVLRPCGSSKSREKQNETIERYRNLFVGSDIKFEEIDIAEFLVDDGRIWDW